MATIINDEKQILALNEVGMLLDEIRKYNALLDAISDGSAYICGSRDEKKMKEHVNIEDLAPSDKKRIAGILENLKNKHIKRIKTLCRSERIKLDPDELAVIGDVLPSSAAFNSQIEAAEAETAELQEVKEETAEELQEETAEASAFVQNSFLDRSESSREF